jgi:hypothetical protein
MHCCVPRLKDMLADLGRGKVRYYQIPQSGCETSIYSSSNCTNTWPLFSFQGYFSSPAIAMAVLLPQMRGAALARLDCGATPATQDTRKDHGQWSTLKQHPLLALLS